MVSGCLNILAVGGQKADAAVITPSSSHCEAARRCRICVIQRRVSDTSVGKEKRRRTDELDGDTPKTRRGGPRREQ